MTPSEEQIRTTVAQQAGTWFVAHQSGSLEHAERAAFVAWLKASPIHVEEYLGVALVAHDLPAATEDPPVALESLLELARADHTDRVIPPEATLPVREPAPHRMQAPVPWACVTSIAAVVLLLTASLFWWRHDGEFLGLPRAYQTAHGEQSMARLPDGSELRLNTDSAVTVRYSRSERMVEIARGQAFFTVSRDDHRRFRVTAGNSHVIAVGTQFDVYRRLDATLVTVVEGSVAVLGGEPPKAGEALPPDALHISAGYQVQIDAEGKSAQPVPVDVRGVVAWQQGKIVFERRPLGEVADEFNRYGSIPIEVDDAALRSLPINGGIDPYDIDSFLAFLQTLDGVRVERTNTRIRVFSVKSKKE